MISQTQRLGLAIMLMPAVFHYEMPWKLLVFVAGYACIYMNEVKR